MEVSTLPPSRIADETLEDYLTRLYKIEGLIPALTLQIWFSLVREALAQNQYYLLESKLKGLLRQLYKQNGDEPFWTDLKRQCIDFLEETDKTFEVFDLLTGAIPDYDSFWNEGEHPYLNPISQMVYAYLKDREEMALQQNGNKGFDVNITLGKLWNWMAAESPEKEPLTLQLMMRLEWNNPALRNMHLERYLKNHLEKSAPAAEFSFPENKNDIEDMVLPRGRTNFVEGALLAWMQRYLATMYQASLHVDDLKKGIHGNPLNCPWFASLVLCIEWLMAFPEQCELLAAYICKNEPTEDARYILGRVLSEMYISDELRPCLVTFWGGFDRYFEGKDFDINLARQAIHLGLLENAQLPKKFQISYPEKLPLTLDELKAFQRLLKLKNTDLGYKPKAKTAPDRMNESIAEVYLWHNGSKERTFVPLAEHPGLSKQMEDTIKEHELQMEGETFDFEKSQTDVRMLWDEAAVPVGTNWSGDMYFVAKDLSVWCFYHDNPLVAEQEARTLPEYLSRIMIEVWNRLNGESSDLKRLVENSTF